jgi:hypothetical protein
MPKDRRRRRWGDREIRKLTIHPITPTFHLPISRNEGVFE